MASENSTLETVYSRGSYLVHLAPEFRQEKHFYLKALCSRMLLPFYCHFTREWWPSQVRQPGHSGLALQLPWDSPCPESSFQGVDILSYSSSKSTTLPPCSLALPPYLYLPLKLGWDWLCSLKDTAMPCWEMQASACAWPPWLPAQDCSRCPLSLLLWVFLHLILPILHPSTFCNILWSSAVFSYLLLKEGWEGEGIWSLPFFLYVRNLQEPQYNPDPKWTQNKCFCFLRLVTLERPHAYH